MRVDTGIQSSNLVTVDLRLTSPYTEDGRAQSQGRDSGLFFGPRNPVGRGHGVLREGTTVSLLGIALGLAGVWAGGGVLESYVFGISPRDPWTIAAVSGLLVAVALSACLMPALKAAGTKPMEVVRAD